MAHRTYNPADIARMLAEARAKVATAQHIQQEIKDEALREAAPVSGTTPSLTITANAGTVVHIPLGGNKQNNNSESETVGEVEQQREANQSTNRLGVARDDITYNTLQQEFIDRASNGEDLVLVGAAGTGKTTSQRGLGKKLITDGRIRPLRAGTKWLRAGVPGVAVVSFTNKAVNNIRHALPDDIKAHALTIHKLLEFAPIFYEVDDPENPGQFKKTMRFEPTRNRYNPLPSDLALVVVEESSMVEVPLWEQFMDACPHKPQVIFLGDIQQLPPVFGSSILGFKMLELPVIELKEVYRQARNSPIIDLAWKILEGDKKVFDSKAVQFKKMIPDPKNPGKEKEVTRIRIPALEALSKETPDGTVLFQPWQKQLSTDLGLITCTKQFCEWADKGYYDADQDIILCPFNVSFGTVELNKGIAQHLGRKRGAVVFEVVAGFQTHYLAEGDRVLYEKEDAFITRIVRNGEYLGKKFQTESEFLDRWGHMRDDDMDADALNAFKDADKGKDEFDIESIEKYIELAASESEDRVTAASHRLTLKITATDEEIEIDAAGDVNNMLGGYAITVHKAQGSEWNKVFFVMQHSHATMNQRELLYTAVTRAKKHLHIICEPSTFEKGIQSQKVIGNTLAEKAVFFKGKVKEREALLAEREKQRKDDDPILLAFSLVEKWDALARDAVQHWWKVAIHHYPKELGGVNNCPPSFNWKITGSARGMANARMNEITSNPVYLHTDPDELIAQNIPHEVAHIVAAKVFNCRGHGKEWQMIMKQFGRDPMRTHNEGKMSAVLTKLMEDASKQPANPDIEE